MLWCTVSPTFSNKFCEHVKSFKWLVKLKNTRVVQEIDIFGFKSASCCLMFPVMSPVSSFLSPVSKLLYQVSCLTTPVLSLLYPVICTTNSQRIGRAVGRVISIDTGGYGFKSWVGNILLPKNLLMLKVS